jgi:membrane-bound metal-dependent hydrolase YbcI (DUF457 family)
MNIATHFATGYLLARGLRYEVDRFETFFMGIAAIAPDADLVANLFMRDFRHAVFSHTIIAGVLMAAAMAAAGHFFSRTLLGRAGPAAGRLLALALIAVASHFVLDVFTYGGGAGPNPAHAYFWPLWRQSFHMDYLWPGIGWRHRLIVEILYSASALGVIVWHDVIRGGKNPLNVFDPRRWRSHAS